MVKVLIADDEKLSRDTIRILLSRYQDIKIVGEVANGKQAISSIKTKNPDLVFLDIQMPGIDGLEVVRRIGPEKMPTTIFVTAYDQYALKAFDAQAIDYLLKPFTDLRFEKALRRARQLIIHRDIVSSVMKLTLVVDGQKKKGRGNNQSLTGPTYISRLPIKAGRKLVLLQVAMIDWVEAADYYVQLHVGSKKYLLRESINNLEKKLDPACFVRVHRAALVQIDRISEITQDIGEQIAVLFDGTRIHISRRRMASVKSFVLGLRRVSK